MGIKNVRLKENTSGDKTAPEASVKPGNRMVQVLNQPIEIGEAHLGNKTISKWLRSIKSATSLSNPRRKELHEMHEDILLMDGFLNSVISKRERAVTTTPFIWEGLEDERFIDNFASPWFMKLLKQVWSRVVRGHTVIEFFQDQDGLFNDTKILPRKNVIPQQQIITDHVLGSSGRSYAEEPACNWILEVGEPDDLGLLTQLIPYVLMKRDNMAFWATYNEVFGMPFRIYYYSPHVKNARAEAVQQAQKQGAAAWAVLPENQTRVEFVKDGTSSASSNGAFDSLRKALNEEITITVLGQTLTTGTDGKGSYALGGIHKEVEEGVNLEDRLWMEYVLNYQFRPLAIKHGYPLEGIKGYFQETERVSMEKKQEMWNKAIEKGLKISAEDYYNEFGIPHPEERGDVIQLPAKDNIDPNPEPEKKKTSLNARLKTLYSTVIPPLKGDKGVVKLSSQSDFEKAWERIIKQMHEGSIKAGDVDQELFDLISAQLTTALDQGFSEAFNKLTPGTKEHELMLQLRENVFVFSGFKTYQELQEASKLLINEAGVIRPFAEFRDEVLKLHQQYDLNYLRTEYNMAVGNAQAAEFWLQVEENSAAKPYLRFSAILDTVSRHKKYHGITRRWDDPIWEWLTPLLDYGCRCLLQMLAEAEVTSPNKLPDPTGIPEMFRFNPGKQKAVFPKNHPYYEVASEDQQAADNLWNLKKPDGDT